MRARQAAPIYFISTLIKRKLIATSLIMLQAAFDDSNGGWKKTRVKKQGLQGVCELDPCVQETANSSNDENKQPHLNRAITRQCQRYS